MPWNLSPKLCYLWAEVKEFENLGSLLKTPTALTSLFWLTIVFYHQVVNPRSNHKERDKFKNNVIKKTILVKKKSFKAVLFMVNLLMLIFLVFHCGVKNMLRQTWFLAIAWYVLNYIMWTNGQPNIWFGTHLPKVTKTYQFQHQHLIHILVGFAVLALAMIIPPMITRY